MPPVSVPRYGLRGRVVTMNTAREVIADGIVWVADGAISDVTPASQVPGAHAASPVIATAGTIYPGMIELHNHLAYNAIPLFRIPKRYDKREDWQGTVGYRRYVSGPAGVVASLPDLIKATVRYVECKSLIAGTTTSQGLTLRSTPIKHFYKGIVRNAELPDSPGLDPARPKIGDVTPDGRESFRKSLDGKGARIVHLAEGLPASKAHQHFLDLKAPGDGGWAIGPKFVGIHSTALTAADLAILDEHGGSIVWSPFSNLALYGDTTDVKTALQLKIKVALGSDWAPTASKNLLNELKVARIHSDDQSLGISDQQFVEMVTVTPAEILGWQAHLGSLEAGKLADLVVVGGAPGTTGTAYRHLVDATESGVELVVIGGVARCGTHALMDRLGPIDEQVPVAGVNRSFHLDTHDPDPVLGQVGLAAATATLKDALHRMPELANAAIGSAELGLVADQPLAGAEPDTRFFLDLDQPPIAGVDPALFAGVAPALLDLVLGAGSSFAPIAVPLEIDPLATEGDDTFFAMLANLANLPDIVRATLPGKYGVAPHAPTVGGFADDDDPIAPLTLDEIVGRPGALTLADRRRIVEQAIVVLDQAYVHLPFKRAMHAVDPLQRLRLLEYRLSAVSATADLPPEQAFHNELIDIFTSLRDLHTSYVPPEPYRSHTVFLPFLIEQAVDANGADTYVVSKVANGADLDPAFVKGVRVTHWSGLPIARAIERNAEHQGGSNHAARLARGLDALTIRTLGRMPPPDEDWVVITYRDDDDVERELRASWRTYQPLEPSPFADASASDGVARVAGDARLKDAELRSLGSLGIDTQTALVNQVRRDLFAPSWRTPPTAASTDLETSLPGVFRARIRPTKAGPVAHVRIFTFLVPDPTAFIDEFVHLVEAEPTVGLVVDVRGNGGGDIRAAEGLLQVLTPRPIEPEPTQFIVSPLIRALCLANGEGQPIDLRRWTDSVVNAVETGATFSIGSPISSADAVNDRGQRYRGPVVLITDARCYSATDLFAAGFQDHAIGPIVGVADNTGAGGANVWTHDLLRRLVGEDDRLAALPHQANFRFAIRRTTRVGPHAGELLEDLGVVPDVVHPLTLHDLLDDNADLLEHAATILAGIPNRKLDAELRSDRTTITVEVAASNVDRVDAFAGHRPLGSEDVVEGACTIAIPRAKVGDETIIRLEGYERKGKLVAARRVGVPG
ncbi:MAG TPA: amidohydrolase family protein [Candidatus Deferrimicrobium sp.]|nr:amidohydrolase family protein [Candidatus Deferrimicrobium sp.]